MIKLKAGVRTSDLKARTSGPRARSKKKSALKFERFFSEESRSPFDEIEWERRVAEITDDGGKVIFRQEDVEVPKTWSALATKIAVSKYFYGQWNRSIRGRSGELSSPADSSCDTDDLGLGS